MFSNLQSMSGGGQSIEGRWLVDEGSSFKVLPQNEHRKKYTWQVCPTGKDGVPRSL